MAGAPAPRSRSSEIRTSWPPSRPRASGCDQAYLARRPGPATDGTGKTGRVEPIPRVAARVVLVDPSDSFLLIRSHDPSLEDSPTWWHVPGGGLDPGESAEQGAIREISEEVGIRLPAVGPTVGTRTTRFTFGGKPYVQRESFFVVRLPERVDVDPARWSALEKRCTHGGAWWAVTPVSPSAPTDYPP
ncbi:NUDIX domain-containing protein, partial [Frankia sp. CNm7]|nr:NUDIX domain-containing protein [Frankia nepalensis]